MQITTDYVHVNEHWLCKWPPHSTCEHCSSRVIAAVSALIRMRTVPRRYLWVLSNSINIHVTHITYTTDNHSFLEEKFYFMDRYKCMRTSVCSWERWDSELSPFPWIPGVNVRPASACSRRHVRLRRWEIRLKFRWMTSSVQALLTISSATKVSSCGILSATWWMTEAWHAPSCRWRTRSRSPRTPVKPRHSRSKSRSTSSCTRPLTFYDKNKRKFKVLSVQRLMFNKYWVHTSAHVSRTSDTVPCLCRHRAAAGQLVTRTSRSWTLAH